MPCQVGSRSEDLPRLHVGGAAMALATAFDLVLAVEGTRIEDLQRLDTLVHRLHMGAARTVTAFTTDPENGSVEI